MDNLFGILGKIGFDWQIALANLFNFLIILFILKKYAFGPIGQMIKERQDKINQGLENAEKNQKLLVESQKNYDEIILSAKKESNDIVQIAKKEASIKKEQLLEEARREVAQIIESGKKSLEIEKVKMLNDARKETADLVIKVAEKVLGERVDDSYSLKITKELNNI